VLTGQGPLCAGIALPLLAFPRRDLAFSLPVVWAASAGDVYQRWYPTRRARSQPQVEERGGPPRNIGDHSWANV
jgi:hypothetical protein